MTGKHGDIAFILSSVLICLKSSTHVQSDDEDKGGREKHCRDNSCVRGDHLKRRGMSRTSGVRGAVTKEASMANDMSNPYSEGGVQQQVAQCDERSRRRGACSVLVLDAHLVKLAADPLLGLLWA